MSFRRFSRMNRSSVFTKRPVYTPHHHQQQQQQQHPQGGYNHHMHRWIRHHYYNSNAISSSYCATTIYDRNSRHRIYYTCRVTPRPVLLPAKVLLIYRHSVLPYIHHWIPNHGPTRSSSCSSNRNISNSITGSTSDVQHPESPIIPQQSNDTVVPASEDLLSSSTVSSFSSSSSTSSSSSSSSTRHQNYQRSNQTLSSSSSSTTTTYDSMMELYDILMSKQMGAFRFPTDYNVYAIQFIRHVVHLNTTLFYGKNHDITTTTSTTTSHSQSDDTTGINNDKNNNSDSHDRMTHHQHSSLSQQQQQQRDKEGMTTVINAAFRLWERTAYEYALRRQQQQARQGTTNNHSTTINNSSQSNNNNNNNNNNNVDNSLLWLHSTRIFDKLLLKWKMVALSSIRTNVPSSKSNTTATTSTAPTSATAPTPPTSKTTQIMSPMEVLQSIQTISNHNRTIPNVNTLFDNHISSYNSILQVLLAQYQRESYYTAPIQLDKFIHQYIIQPAAAATDTGTTITTMSQPLLPLQQPSSKRYEPLSQTAVEFNRKNTDSVYQSKLAGSTTSPKLTILKPNIFTYTILLRAWIQSLHPMSLQEIGYILATIQDIYWYEKNVIPNLNNRNSNDTDHNNSTKATNTKGSAIMDILTPHMLAIRFYANIGDIKEVDSIYEYLQSIDDLPTNDQYGLLLSEMMHSFCTRSVETESGPSVQLLHLKKAEDLFFCFTDSVINVKYDPTSSTFSPVPMEQYSPDTVKAIMKGAHSIMHTYRLLLRPIKKQVIHAIQKQEEESNRTGLVEDGTNPSVKKIHNDEMIARAEQFLEQIEKYEPLDREAFAKLRLPLMDMYSRMHRLPQVQAMFEKYSNGDDNHPHAILIKTYSNCNQPERAEQLVETMLRNESQRDMVDIEIINLLISAWVDCTTCNRTVAADRAHQIYRWIYDHPICIPMKMQPNLETYSYLFNCMAQAGSIRSFNDNVDDNPRNKAITRGIVSKVETLLNEIENRYLTGGDTNCKPDLMLYNCAIQACLNCKEYDQAEYILQMMERRMSSQSQTSSASQRVVVIPDIRTYCLLLHCYSKLGTVKGAQWSEQLHNHMRTLSQTVNPLLKPTATTYNIVMAGWAASDAPDSSDRIWKVYEQMMQVDELELDLNNYTTILTALSKSKTSSDIQRAIELLQVMQTKAKSSSGQQSKIHPDGRHYTMVLRACVDVNDVDNAAYVMNLYIDAYLMQRCRSSDRLDRTIFHWIISTWIKRNELVLASWFMFDTVTAVMKVNKVHISSLTNGNPPNVQLATPAVARVVKTIGIDSEITSKLRSAWRESSDPQHLVEKEKYLTKIKTLITEPIFQSQKQQYHRRFQSPQSSSDDGTTTASNT